MLIAVHGGAGSKRPGKAALKKLEEALNAGYRILENGGGALESVVEAIAALEDSGLFNAGTGGNLQLDGVRRLDASVMDGRGLRSGAVIGLEGIRNPVRAARIVIDSPHRVLAGRAALRISLVRRLPALPPPDKGAVKRLEAARSGKSRAVEYYEKYFSTVGAVAVDKKGDVAAGSSTGGVAAMLPGRVGDTPIIGAGVYAENSTGAISCTGRGEDIIRLALAKEISMNMRGSTPSRAGRNSLKRILRIGGQAGVIIADSAERLALLHTTEYMAGGFRDEKKLSVAGAFEKVL